MGVAVGDMDNDGFDDLLVTYMGGVVLYHNQPGGPLGRRFLDVTARAGLQAVIVTLYGSLAWKIAADGDPQIVLAFRDLILALGVTASLPIAVVMFASAIGLSRGGLAPTWYRWLFLAGAAVALAGGTTWAQDGVWAPDGLVGMLSIAVSLLWMFVPSGLLLRAPQPTEATPERSTETVLYSAARPWPR